MSIDITLRSIKGSPLTASEVDANFASIKTNLTDAVARSGVTSFNTRTGAITLTSADVTQALGFTPGNSSISSFNTRTGAITLTSTDVTQALGFTPISGAGYALIASPAFTGSPTAPTPPSGTNNTRLATAAFVATALSEFDVNASLAAVHKSVFAWVSYNARTQTIRASANVASVTHTAIGRYVINFIDSAGSGDSYSVVASIGGNNSDDTNSWTALQQNQRSAAVGDQTASGCVVWSLWGNTGSFADFDYVNVAIFK